MSETPSKLGLLLSVACLPWAAACDAREEVRPAGMELLQVRPKNRVGVYLNEALVFHFSAAVDPLSVTSESISIRATDGSKHLARGSFEVAGDRVTFNPAPVLEADLSDGGYLPGTPYTVSLRGFPILDGLRSRDGRPLGRSLRWSFETAARSESGSQMFEDHSPAAGSGLRLLTQSIGPGESALIACAEPLDPSTLRSEDFLLQAADGSTPEGIPVGVRLVANDDPGPFPGLGGARIALEILEAGPPAGDYDLRLVTENELRDLGGNPVWAALPPGSPGFPLRVDDVHEDEFLESFTVDGWQSPIPVPGAHGTANWIGGGSLALRIPRAVGDGRDGAQRLLGELGTHELAATSIEVPADALLRLPTTGCVVLRSQTSLLISGELVRRSGKVLGLRQRDGTDFGAEDRGAGVVGARHRPMSLRWEEGYDELSAWVDWALGQGEPWTILIAGGDLVIDGRLDLDGPLLLVAGGSIRSAEQLGMVSAQERQLWVLGRGGGGDLRRYGRPADLRIDASDVNILATELRLAALSDPIPRRGRIARWLFAETNGRAGAGSWRVSYVPADLPPEAASIEQWARVASPRELPEGVPLRFLIELRYPPRSEAPGPWNSPFVDDIHLFWQSETEGGR